MAAIGGFLSDLSKTHKTDRNFRKTFPRVFVFHSHVSNKPVVSAAILILLLTKNSTDFTIKYKSP